MKACDLKKGAVALINGERYIAKDIQVKSPSSRGASTLYKVRFNNVVTKQKFDQTYKGEDEIQLVDFVRRPVQMIFRESNACTFMDNEDFSQYTVDNELIEDELLYLTDGIEGVYALISEGELLGIELPASVNMEIVECSPGIKGASASARTKPATMPTGLVVQVPEYLSP
ncbi:MAG: elongation factor P-like protein YeiP, partial [Gammaproteobacteria bacterium]|nr:elongation factor P-like protein YeiP [Gammaproteobacteria bacterium]